LMVFTISFISGQNKRIISISFSGVVYHRHIMISWFRVNPSKLEVV